MTLGPASVRWNDYVGTAAADDADAVSTTRSLYELAGLDRGRWSIVGVDLRVLESEPQVTVYAVDRDAHGVASTDEIVDLARAHGAIPVTAFHLRGPTQVENFLNDAFKRVAVRLVARAVAEERLTVAAEQQVAAG